MNPAVRLSPPSGGRALLGPRPAVYFRLQGMEPRPVLRPVTSPKRVLDTKDWVPSERAFMPDQPGSAPVLLARLGEVDFEMVLSDWDRHLVGQFVRERYALRGYDVASGTTLDALATFQARVGSSVIGSVSVRLDTKPRGLAAQACYGAEIEALRQRHRLCEFTRLAVEMQGEVSKPIHATSPSTDAVWARSRLPVSASTPWVRRRFCSP
jgi:hypothetical protein